MTAEEKDELMYRLEQTVTLIEDASVTVASGRMTRDEMIEVIGTARALLGPFRMLLQERETASPLLEISQNLPTS